MNIWYFYLTPPYEIIYITVNMIYYLLNSGRVCQCSYEVNPFCGMLNTLVLPHYYIPRQKSGIYWIQVRRAAAAAVEISLWTR